MCAIVALTAALTIVPVWAQAVSLTDRQDQVQQHQSALRLRLQTLQKNIEARESARKAVVDALRQSETAISQTNQRLTVLTQQHAQAKRALLTLERQVVRQQAVLKQYHTQLARQLRAQYASGFSPWAALLSGDDPQQLGRHLTYLDYVLQVQIGMVRALRRETHKLAQLRLSAQAYRQEIAVLVQKVDAQKAAQEVQKKERLSVLARLEGRIAAERQEAVRLGRDDQQMTRLIKSLQKTIARQAEVRRLANTVPQQTQAQHQTDTLLKQSQAQHQANTPLQQTEVQRKASPAPKPTAQTGHVNEGLSRPQAVQPIPADNLARDTSQQALSWAQGLRPGLPMPVQNATLQGRFGVSRPDDKGVWRGIVLRAAEGTPVQVIAQGMVVYASWLRGFGNLMIVDHGRHYMSVYAYNHSLLKQVGDHVAAGETVATVGATGGQVESGLYFEIRYGGAPLDPLQWLAP